MQSSNIPKLFHMQQRPSIGKQNLCYSTYEPTDRNENDNMIKQFQTLKQINRIIDSNPQSQDAKDQKIRSLVVMFKRQLDINRNLQNQLIDYHKKVQGMQKELLIRNIQVKNYQKTIFEQKQSIVIVQSQNKRFHKVIDQNKEEIKIRQDLIQKMKQTYENQKYSMENQLHFLKQKTVEHFSQKLNFPIHSLSDNKENVKKSRTNSSRKSEGKSGSMTKTKQKSSKKDIIRRNILAISRKENDLMTGQNLLKKFQQARILSQRMSDIRKGNYHSSMGSHY